MLGLSRKISLFFFVLMLSFSVKGNSDTVNVDHVYRIVDTLPEFPGGREALLRFMSQHIRFPVMNRSPQFQGTIFVTFVVEIDGSLTNIEILRRNGHLPEDSDEQVIRLVENMPKWTPGRNRGKAVRTQFNLPVRFSIAG